NILGPEATQAELDELCRIEDPALAWATVWMGEGRTATAQAGPGSRLSMGNDGDGNGDRKGEGKDMGATVTIGDKRTVAGIHLTVVEVQHTTDADGKVTFATGAGEIKLTVEKAPDEALASVTDPLFTAFVLRADADQTGRMGSGLPETRGEGEGLFGVGVQHPALGERIGALTELPIIETITMGWKCPEITIKHNGVEQEGAHVTFVLRRRSDLEDGGVVEHWFGADRFKGLTWSEEWQSYVAGDTAQGEWETDADGIVHQNFGDGSGLHEIYFPNGDGALFQRIGDHRDEGSGAPTEYAEEVRCYYRGSWVVVHEGQEVEIDLTGASIVIQGEPDWRAFAWMEDVGAFTGEDLQHTYGSVALDGSGQGTIAGLQGGRYVIVQRKFLNPVTPDWTGIARRIWADVAEGQTKAITLPAGETPSPGNVLGYIYTEGATLADDAGLYARAVNGDNPPPAPTATGGRMDCTLPYGPPVIITATAAAEVRDIFLSPGKCFEIVLGGRFIIVTRSDVDDRGEARWWNGLDAHENLNADERAYILRCDNAAVQDRTFKQRDGALVSEPTPYRLPYEWVYDPFLDESRWTVPGSPEYLTWSFIDAGSGAPIPGFTGLSLPHWPGFQDAGHAGNDETADGTSVGSLGSQPTLRGGKVSGDCVDDHDQLIDDDQQPEAARLGIEYGDTGTSIELRVLATPTDPDDETRAMAVRNANVCPYCLGPVWRAPSAGSYIYGFCTQSTCGNDARPYLRTPTLAAGAYDCRAVRYAAGKRSSIKLTRWLRPVNYIENDDYLQLYHGYPRWVAQHPTLASWGEGGFTDGDDAAEIVSTNGLEEGTGLYVQPKILPADIAGDADYIIRCTNPDGKTRDKRAHLNVGRKDPLRLTRARKTGGADGDNPSAFDWISDIYGIDSEEPGFNSFAVVGESPALVMGQTPVANTADTPWACQFQVRCGEPHHDVDGAGRIWRALNDEGTIRIHVRESPQRPWVERAPAFDEALEYCHPCILRMNDGRLMVCATVVGGKTRWRRSCDDGRHWEVVAGANVLANDLSCGVAVQMVGIILAAGYDDGTIYFELSNDNGVTTDTLRNGRTRAAIAQGDEAQPSLMVLFTGEILASITRGTGGVTYVSRDWGEHWTAVDQVV
ncbi:MAG TPA: hypothetical protein VNA25_19830, partial [Phycisphaerae bacterium]|nr:hypothetical protein [Phycisphaerae bacterium]